ncbi:hypothetical protein [Lentzea sp. NPDC060358]|uniref:hypothetical protein n=1 Tax=Lentzea sp. NPDC060358 TaxID=3347103 RepID=UPI003661D8C0
MLDVAGAQPVLPLEGMSLAGHLLGGEAAPARDLLWRTETQRALVAELRSAWSR